MEEVVQCAARLHGLEQGAMHMPLRRVGCPTEGRFSLKELGREKG